MSHSLFPFSIVGAAAATLALLGACTSSVIVDTGGSDSGSTTGSGDSGGGSGGSSGNGGSGSSSSSGTGGGNACTEAGGTCKLSGETCTGSTGLAGSCGPAAGAFCCVPATACEHACAMEDMGAGQCAGTNVEVCLPVGSCLVWVITSACAAGVACDSAGKKCLGSESTCVEGGDVACGCACGPTDDVECTGGIPSTCAGDADCGPPCAGLVCHAGQCLPWACNPGTDAMCNEDTSMSALAGTCNADGSCACQAGFTRQSNGKCG